MNTPDTKPAQTENKTSDDEIDLIALAKTLWNGRRTVIKFILIGMVLGLVFALITPKEFIASTVMVPQTSSSTNKLGGLSSLAAMAGVNLGSGSTAESLSPMIYPQIMQSIPFQLELMDSQFKCPDVDQPVSLFDYYTEYEKPGLLGTVKKYTFGLPGLILKAVKGKPDQQPALGDSSRLLSLTEDQDQVRKKISEQISLDINDKDGYITLSSRFNDPLLAAQVAQKAQSMLQEYITKYKLEKAADQLRFVEARFQEKKAEFEEAQKDLALFRDRNKNVSSAIAMTEQEQLQSQYNLAYSVYSELAKQVEQAQIQVKEDTPILTVIEPVRVPLEKSKPNRPLILIIWIFLGGIIGVGTVFGREFYSAVKERWSAE
ncbi:Wzz/FepE/Etk N-terminal domain-containing protein [Mangrovibacterium diazotrophicum]|uniref:Putative tyrosine kinase-like protein n=1 Tax=Mangrovibacterium diazotrophicum TaxID=1261403 RepID=A0A419W5P3_9BACT|nr:Wzz/FepE/Etk N-terminal domain-containing protein [Mangrovibacterium diazotrophicum]RKD90767.1 putative tyrosine kinase-like protein [Mangrovibacterium diazotrophicum]